jgi:ATPase family associated with various cellular activities (AAA)
METTFSEQLIVIATVIGAVAAMPVLIEFLMDTFKKRERIALSLDDEAIADIDVRLAGLDALLNDIADLIDRVRSPKAYADIRLGNEILIFGPPLSGKKSLAKTIAQRSGIERLITVHNPRNADALAKAKRLIQNRKNQKTMLLLPRLDLIDDKDDKEIIAELDALIETVSDKDHVLIVGTTSDYIPGGIIDNLFGIILTLPGAVAGQAALHPIPAAMRAMLDDVVAFYYHRAEANGMRFSELPLEKTTNRILMAARNPAEIEDMMAMAETMARHRLRTKQVTETVLTPNILEAAIHRVVPYETRA